MLASTEGAQIGVFLMLAESSRPMVTEAVGAGQYTVPGLSEPVPRIQIVTIEQAMALRHWAVQLPVIRQDALKRSAKEEDVTRQKAMDL